MNPSLAATVLAASLLGSVHCAGMCGPFVMLATASDRRRSRFPAALLAYHSGRLTTYLTLGLIAGTAGHALNLTGQLWGIQQIAAYMAGCAMVFMGGAGLLRLWGVRLHHFPAPQSLTRAIQAGFRKAARWPAELRAWWIGLLTTWLPCGWLYAFVLIAAGAGSLLNSLLLMFAFWLGTLPLLSLLSWGSAVIAPNWRAAIPWVSAVLMLVVGTHTIVARAQGDVASLSTSMLNCTDKDKQVRHAANVELPCCHAH